MRYGHFSGDEYIVDRPDVPVSWTNDLGGKDFCTVISHNGGGYSYHRSAQTGRITRFRQNGVPLDRPGKYVYLRDEEFADHWSVSWQPVGEPFLTDPAAPVPDDGTAGRWTARHGLGHTTFAASYRGIDASRTVFVPLDDSVQRVWREATYLIDVGNPSHVSHGVASLVVDGTPSDPGAAGAGGSPRRHRPRDGHPGLSRAQSGMCHRSS